MKNNLFGTDGIRQTVGVSPLTPTDLERLGRAIGRWAQQKYADPDYPPSLLIGHDTRVSYEMVKTALKKGLLQYPCTLHDAEIMPTPAIFKLVCFEESRFDYGIIISASHNPYQDNGIKIVDRLNGKISLEDEQLISDYFHQDGYPLGTSAVTNITQDDLDEEYDPLSHYADIILNAFCNDFLKGKKIVLDCANGALYAIAPAIFEFFGAHVITLNDQPNGININDNCGALHPEQLQQAVLKRKADIGFAFDGDGDRVIAVSRDGIVKDGDDLLAILLEHPKYKNNKTLVGTIMTNQGFEQHLKTRGINLIRTPVGDKYVSQEVAKNNYCLGGEQSGHIILPTHGMTGDGIVTALGVLEVLTATNNWSVTTFTKFPQILINVPVAIKKDLARAPLAPLIAASNAQLPEGRLVVRYSGTENLLRIMIEDSSLATAQTVGNQLAEQLRQELA